MTELIQIDTPKLYVCRRERRGIEVGVFIVKGYQVAVLFDHS
jgi:hypothetical protein